MKRMLEVCCADIASVRAAKEGGADRVELCVDLAADGLTPSPELLREALQVGIRVHVLIRPRSGNFVYSDDEVEQMAESIRLARQLGAQGVVIGCLTEEGDIDMNACRWLMYVARGRMRSAADNTKYVEPVSVTFHRAFDVCREPMKALRDIVELGCDRLLTSGQASTALEGAALIRELIAETHRLAEEAGTQPNATDAKRLIILAGAGVTPDNVAELIAQTGATEVHGSLRGMVDGVKVTTVENVMRTADRIKYQE